MGFFLYNLKALIPAEIKAGFLNFDRQRYNWDSLGTYK